MYKGERRVAVVHSATEGIDAACKILDHRKVTMLAGVVTPLTTHGYQESGSGGRTHLTMAEQH